MQELKLHGCAAVDAESAPIFPDISISPPPGEAWKAAKRPELSRKQESSLGEHVLGVVATLFPWLSRAPLAPCPGTALAWHTHQLRLAAADGAGRIQLFDLMPTASHQAAQGSKPPQPAATLQHELLSQVTSLDFRPHSRGELAVGFREGALHWRLWQQPTAARRASCQTQLSAEGIIPSGGAQPRLLRPASPAHIAAVAWSPCGRLLAGAHGNGGGCTVWDATGTATPLSAGTGPVTRLRWSPDGSYLLTAGPGGRFSLWETERWRHASFHSPTGSAVAGLAWSPDSRVALLAFSGSACLCALHLIGQPPSLRAQLLPLDLPELASRGSTPGGRVLAAMDWDASGERLAVACGPDSEAAGDVALYATSSTPVVRAHCLGFVSRGKQGGPVASLRFHPAYAAGALLAIAGEDGAVSTVPLLFGRSGAE